MSKQYFVKERITGMRDNPFLPGHNSVIKNGHVIHDLRDVAYHEVKSDWFDKDVYSAGFVPSRIYVRSLLIGVTNVLIGTKSEVALLLPPVTDNTVRMYDFVDGENSHKAQWLLMNDLQYDLKFVPPGNEGRGGLHQERLRCRIVGSFEPKVPRLTVCASIIPSDNPSVYFHYDILGYQLIIEDSSTPIRDNYR